MRFSIVTVTYNSEKTIQRTLSSIKAQSFDDFEYIIIDGKSKDNTIKIINDNIDAFNDKIKVISEIDDGIYDAMNKGIKNAKGEWIVFINSDDWINTDTLEVVDKNIAIFDDVDVFYGQANMIRENSEEIERVWYPEELNKINRGIPFCHQTVYIKTNKIKQLGGFDTNFKIGADWDLIIRLKKSNAKFFYIENILANFYTGGISSKKHNRERHLIRKKNKLYNIIDIDYIKDIICPIIDRIKEKDGRIKNKKGRIK